MKLESDLVRNDCKFCEEFQLNTQNSSSRTAAFAATKYATGHLHILCLRSHCMTHLAVSDQIEAVSENVV